jgi:hypothetical protein
LTRAPLRVSVIPPSPGLENNALFNGRRLDKTSHSPNTHWLDWLAEVYKRANDFDMSFGTSDVLPACEADVMVYMAHPLSPNDVAAQKLRNPKLFTILLTYETAVGARYTFNPKNHEPYDAIITYNKKLVDDRRYFYIYPRSAYYRHRIREGLSFEQRRVGCLVGTNRKMRYRSGILTMRKGWNFSLRDWVDYIFCPGQLISYRSEVGKACAQYEAGTFDIFGEGWELLPETLPIFRGVPHESTLNYIGNYRYYFAFENHASDSGLISERVWDALWGDTVPVYIGNKNIDQFIPRECFVDASKFNDPREMLDWLCQTSKETWSNYREAGRQFIRSRAIEKFMPESFAEEFLRLLGQIILRSQASRTL